MATIVGGTPELSADKIFEDLMSPSSTETPIEEEKKEEVKEEETIEEPKEEENEEEEVKEEEIEFKEEDELEFKDIPKRQQILKEFPELFKKFPGIESAIYREQQYSELFPTVADAKEAQEKVGRFNQVENELLSGSLEGILNAVKDAGGEAFGKITGSILQTLHKVDQNAYYNTINHVLKNGIIAAYNTGKQSNDEQLQIAAQLIHKFIYNTAEISAAKPLIKQESTEENPREKALIERERSFNTQQFNIAISDVTNRTDNLIKAAIDKHIDPRNTMSSYVRGKAIDDIMSAVDRGIGEDKRFKSVLDRLWEASYKENFSEQSKLKIRNALLSKAKTILPDIIRRVRGEALKNASVKVKQSSSEEKEEPTKEIRRTAPSKSNGDDKNKVPRGMSTLDFLMKD